MKKIYNQGINDIGERVYKLKSYRVWYSVLTRVFSEKYHSRHKYENVEIYEDWLLFSNFKLWFDENYVEGWELDKDLFSGECKTYSPETCVFLPKMVNGFLTFTGRLNQGQYPVGVNFKKKIGKFQARCHDPITGKSEYLGVFEDPYEAHIAWKNHKLIIANKLCDKFKLNKRILNRLRYKVLNCHGNIKRGVE